MNSFQKNPFLKVTIVIYKFYLWNQLNNKIDFSKRITFLSSKFSLLVSQQVTFEH